ncbi:MAG: DUF2238 domain-containing protein [Planctomycetes bacterium]|nr:DUF2238 domain-containing protein [Planctomycetota bacterium]
MKWLTWRRGLVMLAAVLLPVGCIRMEGDRTDIMLMHVPTLLSLGFGIALAARAQVGAASCAMLFSFYLLHLVGAHYYYSCVPYDDWSRALLGVSPTESFGFVRNHYDRVVHFAFGALLFQPAREWLRRQGLKGFAAGAGSVVLLLAASAFYELFEWLVAVTMSPDQAERYNGQQGDFWDAQKDMAIAFAGSLVAAFIALSLPRRQTPHQPQP